MGLYSQESNNKVRPKSSVSPQTGQHTFATTLLTLGSVDNTGESASREIGLSYSSLDAQQTSETSYGTGWSLTGISTITDMKTFSLSNNQSFSYSYRDADTGLVHFRDQKAKDFSAFSVDDGESFVVYNKDGVVEVLYSTSSNNYLLYYLYFPNGEEYSLAYNFIQNQNCLREIKDQNGTVLLELEYNGTFLQSVKTWRDTGYATMYTTISSSGSYSKLTRIESSVGSSDTSTYINFEYTASQDYIVISKITYKEGATETIGYDTEGHLYNTGVTISKVPRVANYSYSPGENMVATSESYNYPDTSEGSQNFLGYPNTYNWVNGQDNLYEWGGPNSYSYWVEVTTSKGSAEETVKKCIFNTFHLQLSETTTRMECVVQTSYDYPCYLAENVDKNFADQPCNVKYPTKVTKTFKKDGSEQSYVAQMETDDYGNQVKNIAPSGLIQTFTFYPPEGEVDNCPADPFGCFARFSKSATTASADNTVWKAKRYYYDSLSPLSAGAEKIKNVVKVSKIELADEEKTQATVTLTHVDDVSSYWTHNRINHAELLMEGDDGTLYKTSCDFSFEVDETTPSIKRACTVTGHDGSTFSRSDTRLPYSNLLIHHVDRLGVTREATFDMFGNPLTQTSSRGTTLEQVTTFVNKSLDSETNSPTAVQIEPSGVRTRLRYDGDGRIVIVEKTFSGDDDTFYEVISQAYDEFEQITSVTQKDYSLDGGQISCVTTEKTYDGWGLLAETKTNDGVVTITENDPFELKRSQQLVIRDANGVVSESLAKHVTTFNLFHSPTALESQSLGGTASAQIAYDSLGRKTKVTTAMGYETEATSMDIFDRVLSGKDPLGRVFSCSYEEFSPQHLVRELRMKRRMKRRMKLEDHDIVIGQQNFDGIGRVTSKSVNGVLTTYGYSGGFTLPNLVSVPSGGNITLDYNSELGGLPESISLWEGAVDSSTAVQNVFTYGKGADEKLACLQKAERGDISQQFQYDTSGNLSEITYSDGTSSASSVYESRSLLGKLLSASVIMGERTISKKRTYDSYGRLISSVQDAVETSLEYDSFGRVNKETITDITAKETIMDIISKETITDITSKETITDITSKETITDITSGSNVKQTTSVIYDDLSRETSRTISVPSSDTDITYTIENTYDLEGRITKRTVSCSQVLKLVEQFGYDECGRLLTYQVSDGYDSAFLCKGGEKEETGIISQTFSFGDLNNISSISTTFDGGLIDEATWEYNNTSVSNPCTILHTLSSHYYQNTSLSYDANGNLSDVSRDDGSGGSIALSHDVCGRLISLKDSGSSSENVFKYDAFERVAKVNSGTKYYNLRNVVSETDGSTAYVDYIRCGGHVVAEKRPTEKLTVLGCNHLNSAVLAHTDEEIHYQAYGPFGSGDPISKTGYNGESCFKGEGGCLYFLGNGTRVYMPRYAMFSSMDSFSPFSGGGINPFMYCKGNPINLTDPTGHLSSETDLSLNIACLIVDAIVLVMSVSALVASGGALGPAVAGVCGAVYGIRSDTLGIAADSMAIHDANSSTDRSEMISKLGVASSAFGIASVVADLPSAFESGVKSTSKSFGKAARDSFADADAARAGKALSKSSKASKSTSMFGTKGSYRLEKSADQLYSQGMEMAQKQRIAIENEGIAMKATSCTRGFIACTVGLDFDSVEIVLNSANAVSKRAKHGAWATAQVAAQFMTYTLLAEGTWHVDHGDEPEESVADVDGVMNETTKMVFQKFPMP